MNKTANVLIVITLFAAVFGIIIYRHYNAQSNNYQAIMQQINDTSRQSLTPLPRLLELGSHTCAPCRMMAPILKELNEQYSEQLKIEYIDALQNPEAVRRYGIRLIPVQIFYDASGKELFRHEGFFSKEDILAKWKELGVELTKSN